MNLHDQDNFRRGKKEGYIAGISQGLQQGISQGEQQAKIETAKNLLSHKIPIDVIANSTGLSIDTIKNLK